MGLPAGSLDIAVPLLSLHHSPVGGVQVTDQCGKRRPDIVGKAGHELPVCFLGPAECQKPVFVRPDNVIDRIGKGSRKLVCFRQNTPISVPIFYIL